MDFFRKILKHKIWSSVIIILVLVGAYVGYRKIKGSTTSLQYVTQAVTKGTLTTSVSGTGQVEASNQIDIKPQTDGRLISVKVKENQEVKEGDIIAVIDQQSAANNVAQARASLEQAQANYDKLIDGATQNEIATQELSVKSAQMSLDSAKTNLETVKQQQTTSVGNAYRNMLNTSLAALPGSGNTGSDTVTLGGTYSGSEQGEYDISIYNTGSGLRFQYSGLESGNGEVNTTPQPLGAKGLYIQFSSRNIPSNDTWTISIPNLAAAGYLANYNTYQTALQNQTQAITQAQSSIDSAENNLEKTNLSFSAATEPPTQTEVASAKAQVTSAQAQLSNAQTAYENTILKAPFDGVVASLNFSTGDKVTAGTAVATLITKQQIAKFSLNEVDAAKVKVGQKATLTFSAISDLSLTGKVADVDNIGTVSQNVVSFNVKILLDTQNEQIKPGMSVAATVITDAKQDVLMVPTAAIKTTNGQSYVQVLENGKPVQHSITTGSSNDTDTEISGDIKEGDEVVTQTITASSASNTSGSSLLQGLFGGNRNTQTRSTTSSTKTTGTSSSSSKGSSGSTSVEVGPPPGM